jgi:hypothetical protein
MTGTKSNPEISRCLSNTLDSYLRVIVSIDRFYGIAQGVTHVVDPVFAPQ